MKKKALWTVLAIILIGSFLLVGCSSSGDENTKAKAEIIEFGVFPQSIKAADVTITETIVQNSLYLGSDGAYYTKVTAKPYKANYTFSDGTVIEEGVDYYFKDEPIKWRVLSKENGTALILSEKILYSEKYYKGTYTIESGKYYIKSGSGAGKPINSYAYSNIRKYINGDFFSWAFTEEAEFDRVQPKLITGDNVFLAEEEDVTSGWYGFNVKNYNEDPARVKITTDFARALGAEISTSGDTYGAGIWWLGSKHTIDKEIAANLKKNGFSVEAKTEEAAVVTAKGACEGKFVLSQCGVVPAMRITLS